MGAEFENLLGPSLSAQFPASSTPGLCSDRHQEALSFNAAATLSAHINRVLAACSFQFVTSQSPNGVGSWSWSWSCSRELPQLSGKQNAAWVPQLESSQVKCSSVASAESSHLV